MMVVLERLERLPCPQKVNASKTVCLRGGATQEQVSNDHLSLFLNTFKSTHGRAIKQIPEYHEKADRFRFAP